MEGTQSVRLLALLLEMNIRISVLRHYSVGMLGWLARKLG